MAFEDSYPGFKQYLRDIGQFPLLTVAQEIQLAQRMKAGDEKAKAEMVQSNLRLVVKIAREYSNYGLPLVDLISEGNIGLIKAVERFDPTKGGKLSTYASHWIKQGIKRGLANQSKTIRLPVHLLDKISKIRKVAAKMTEEFGREPSDEEIADELGIPVAKVTRLRESSANTASLDAVVGSEDSSELIEFIGNIDGQDPFEMLRDKNIRSELAALVVALGDRERKILNSRFGLDGSRPQTLEEVGSNLGVTRERVRQLQNIALVKLRKALRKIEKLKLMLTLNEKKRES